MNTATTPVSRPLTAEPMPATPRRNAKPSQIKTSDLLRIVRAAIASAEESDLRPQRPMVSGSGFEPMYREYERRSDRFSCFLACLTGALSVTAPAAASEIYDFIGKVHSGDAFDVAAADQPSIGRSDIPCELGHPGPAGGAMTIGAEA